MRLRFTIFLSTSMLFFSLGFGQKNNAFALQGVKWQTSTIQVTWENPSPSDETEREWVKQAITNTWQKESNLQFVDWGKAQPDSKGIRIKISDENPACAGLGMELDGVKDGMILDFTFDRWSPVMKSRRKDYIIAIAVHEFGHALGFAHEHNRKDCYFCDEKPQGTDGDYYITTCDPNSVMNYCNPNYSNWGRLSEGDIFGIRTLYGPPSTPQQPQPTIDYNISLSHTVRDITQDELTDYPNCSKFIKIYVTGREEALNNLENVTYELHPTFTKRFYTVNNKDANFGLGIYVWGMFTVRAVATFKDGTVKNLSRYLSFDPTSTPVSPTSNNGPITPVVTAQSLGNNRYYFRIQLGGIESFKNDIDKVVYDRNDPSFDERYQTETDPANNFEGGYNGWGCLRNLGITIYFKNGSTKHLSVNMCDQLGW